jgi:hypothetical protein
MRGGRSLIPRIAAVWTERQELRLLDLTMKHQPASAGFTSIEATLWRQAAATALLIGPKAFR